MLYLAIYEISCLVSLQSFSSFRTFWRPASVEAARSRCCSSAGCFERLLLSPRVTSRFPWKSSLCKYCGGGCGVEHRGGRRRHYCLIKVNIVDTCWLEHNSRIQTLFRKQPLQKVDSGLFPVPAYLKFCRPQQTKLRIALLHWVESS